jgi:calcineurin-like phosphoesterase family protein
MHPDMWRFTKNIHGHTHGNLHRSEEYINYYSKDFHIDISPELIGYRPLTLEVVLKLASNSSYQKRRESTY